MAVSKIGLPSESSAVYAMHFAASQAGDVLYIEGATLSKASRHIQGASFQSSGAAVIALSLSPEALIKDKNPVDLNQIQWDADIPLNAKVITRPGKTFTIARVTFTVPGELHVAIE